MFADAEPQKTFPPQVLVPAGSFLMGSDIGDSEEQPIHPVRVDAFHIDIYPVTNRQFKIFLKDEEFWRRGAVISRFSSPYYLYMWPKELIFPHGKRDHPVVYVSWYAAAAYCNWRSMQEGLDPCYQEDTWICNFDANGYRLPTEAEYEYAARGGHEQRVYPWGNDINKTSANYGNHIGDTTEALSYPPNDYGITDMGGNISHWCQDWFAPEYYAQSTVQNPHGSETGTHKIYRGGGWGAEAMRQRCAARRWLLPVNCNPDFGFRCVRRG